MLNGYKRIFAAKRKRGVSDGRYKRTPATDSRPITGSRRLAVNTPTGSRYAALTTHCRYSCHTSQAGHRDHSSVSSSLRHCPSCENWESEPNPLALPRVQSFVLLSSLIHHNLKLVNTDKGTGVDFFPPLFKSLNILLGVNRHTCNLFKSFVKARQVFKILGKPLAFVRA